MTITANSGPFISYGITVSASGGQGEYNEHRGPSLVDLGDGLLDPRQQFNYGYQPGQGSSAVTFGFWGLQAVVDFIPTTISTNNIASNQAPVSGTALSLNTASSGVGTVTVTAPETGKAVTGLVFIDAPCGGSTNAGVQFGQTGSVQIWNPASLAGRGVQINLSSNLDGGSWTIAGRDAYGFKVTEQIAAGATTLNSKKTYKYISAIIPSTTVTSTGVTVGTQDLYGFPMYVAGAPYATIWIGPSSQQSLVTVVAGNHTFGSSLVTATATNGDVRGTYASSAASNSTGASPVRITMIVTPQLTNTFGSSASGLQNITATSFYGLFGAAQFSSV